jgi:RND family efflux transporter MFP subunit
MRTLSLGALAMAFLVALGGCGTSERADAPATSRPVAGARLRLAPVDVTDWKDSGGEITTTDRADARARIAGVLDTLTVRKGDMVAKGQPIGRVVDTQLSYQAAAYGAQASAAEAQAGQAQADLARVRYLYDKGVYAKARLDQAEASAATARAQIRSARAQQSAVTAVAGQGLVLAPSSGRVLVADVPAGSAVSAGTLVATITSGPLVVRLGLPESLGGKVAPGARVMVALPDRPVPTAGTVTKVYPAIEAGRIAVDVAVPGIDGSLIGRRVTARVATGSRRALMVPRTFVTTRFGIDYVTVLTGDGLASTVPVQVTAGDDGRVEILSGVGIGDTLVGPAAPR